VHDAGQQALKELPLPEDDHRFIADARGDLARAVDRLRSTNEAGEEDRAPAEERTRDDEQRRKSDRPGERRYDPRTFRNSAEIAGTISCRFPITA
jgi:hypothetical protein